MTTVDVFFDYSSPWTYLCCSRVEEVCRRQSAAVSWRPILVGGIFNTVNPSVYATREHPVPAKARYMVKDLRDWANLYGLRILFPPSVFPVNSVKALRGAAVAEEHGKLADYSARVFEIYWGEDRDISKDEILRAVVREVGLDPVEYFEKIARPDYKQRVRDNTEECIARGGFGSPSMFLEGDLYFGNDRLVLLEEALRRRRGV